jgi:carbohydrate esterase-like sialic acid-specific acetylesterase/PEP-CTERM motif-containing protein
MLFLAQYDRHRYWGRALCLCAVMLLGINGSAWADGEVVHVFFAGGQSNAYPGQFDVGVEQGLTNSGKFGDFEMVADNQGGLAMEGWVAGSYGAFARGDEYRESFFNDQGTGVLQQTLAEVRANGDTPEIGLFWFQGESDSTGTSLVQIWDDKFVQLLQFIQEDAAVSTPVTFGMAIIDGNPLYLTQARLQLIEQFRQMQFDFLATTENGVGWDSRDYERYDIWHLTPSERLAFGEALGEAYAQSIPEPATMGLLAMGGLALLRRKNRK